MNDNEQYHLRPQRVQEELDEATQMRVEAEGTFETDVIAECKAAEDNLKVYIL